MARQKVLNQSAEGVNAFGIPLDYPAAVAAVKAGTITAGDKGNGQHIGLFAIEVATTDKETGEKTVHYSTGGEKVQPFGFTQVNGLAQVFDLEDDAKVALLGEILAGKEDQCKQVVDLHNTYLESSAKSAVYMAIRNQYAPEDQETRNRKIENTIRDLMKYTGKSYEEAAKFVRG